ncbi:MAG: sigma-54-dependent transcriptional regulator [Rickettsiaceae bacterium]
MALDVLIVDDEIDICNMIADIVKDEGHTTHIALNSSEVFKKISTKVPSVIILDVWLQGSELDGLGILEIVKKRYPLMPIIVISGHGTIETAVNAIKIGAYDYIEKPFTHDKLLIVLKRAYESSRLKRENLHLKSKVIDKTELIGDSHYSTKLKIDIEKVTATSGRIMIHGPVGSGKELAARLIHKKSKYSSGAFVIFNPTSMPLDKMQQELFGLEKNEVNNLPLKRISVLEAANGGTLYIDEIGDLHPSAQGKLLKFLQNQTLDNAANGKPLKIDLRIIASTTKDLEKDIEEGKFRKDLYYRLNVIPLRVPSLFDRKDDIELLVKHFIRQLSKFSGLKEREFSDKTITALQAYSWPGNVRQLRNIIEWILIMYPSYMQNNELITPDMLPQDILKAADTITKPDTNIDMMSMPLREAREVFERQYLLAQIVRFNYNISRTSFFVGMERSALHRKLKSLSIYPASNKSTNKEEEENHEKAI